MTFPLSREVEQPAQFEILSGDDIAMEKDDWPPPALFEIVKPGTVDSDKPPTRWMHRKHAVRLHQEIAQSALRLGSGCWAHAPLCGARASRRRD
jgi:hypothetical protein